MKLDLAAIHLSKSGMEMRMASPTHTLRIASMSTSVCLVVTAWLVLTNVPMSPEACETPSSSDSSPSDREDRSGLAFVGSTGSPKSSVREGEADLDLDSDLVERTF